FKVECREQITRVGISLEQNILWSAGKDQRALVVRHAGVTRSLQDAFLRDCRIEELIRLDCALIIFFVVNALSSFEFGECSNEPRLRVRLSSNHWDDDYCQRHGQRKFCEFYFHLCLSFTR